jgi:UDP-N-acetylmuramoyl-L-alanyl-D-glutamate--2,6-diaminopimelate ligase
MEVSSHALELKRVKGINFALTIFTNLSGEHLDYHQTMENYYQAKKKLFSLYHPQMAVINYDDPWGKRLIEEIPAAAVTYGLHSRGTIYSENYHFTSEGIEASIKYPAGRLKINSPLLGRPNLYNILAAVAAALTLGINPAFIKEGVQCIETIPGRFEKIDNPWGINIFVDYAHTDDALKNLLETARELTPARVIVVFGAGGDRDKTKRPRMGRVAAELADWTIITSDNPRSEDPQAIITDIEKGFKQAGKDNYEIEPDRRLAIRKALLLAKKDDCLLIAGKGHEDYQIIGQQVIPFHDPTVIQELIKELGRSRG